MPSRPDACIGKNARLKPPNISPKIQRAQRSDSVWPLISGNQWYSAANTGNTTPPIST